MADLGTDFHLVTDLDANLSPVSGGLCLTEAVVRRLSTPRGALFYDADYGTDVRQYLNSAGLSEFAVAAAVESESLKDERVESAAATVTINAADKSLTVDLRIDTDDGPFVLTISVDDLTVELIDFSDAT